MKYLSIILVYLIVVIGSVCAQQAGVYGHYEVYDTDLLPREEFATRRAEALKRMEPGSVMVLLAAESQTRSNDVSFQYRQDNNLLYLTGVTEDRSALVLTSTPVTINGTSTREILFVKNRNAFLETWTGVVMGPTVASQVTGIPVTLPIERLRGLLDTLIKDAGTVYGNAKRRLPEPPGRLRGGGTPEPLLGEVVQGKQIVSDMGILAGMRTIKSPAEIAMMRRAINISVEAHRRTISSAKPGMKEYELQAIMEGTFMGMGSEYPGYPSIIGSGANTCILHYESNRRKTNTGNLVLMDCGAEYHGYTADVTRTFPIDGKFTPEQRIIYNLVLEAQDSGIAACRVGRPFREAHERAMSVITRGLLALGIIQQQSNVRMYFMHSTSHFLGMDVHDVGNFAQELQPGMVMTVEPGIYIPPNSPCDKKWWNIGVRIEDDILVTPSGPENLSGGLERKAEDIEKLMMK